jgi:hypothetical protein
LGNGLLLAVSAAGGTQGERVFPLLKTDEDWEILAGRAREILTEIPAGGVRPLLSGLRAAFSALADSAALHTQGPALARLTRVCLSATRERWNARDEPIPIGALEEYVELSTGVRPVPPMPDLSRTWAHLCPTDTAEIADAPIEVLDDWARLTHLAQGAEPRFLRQVKYPRQHTGILEAVHEMFAGILGNMETIDDPDPIEPAMGGEAPSSSFDDWEESEASELESALRTLELYEPLWADAGVPNEAQALSMRMEEQRSVREERADAHRMFEEAEPDDEDDDHRSGVAAPSFDIDAVFRDL